jgi:hypothetical protein
MAISRDLRFQLIELKNRIVSSFRESEWLELGTLTDHFELVVSHQRLLRSLRFGDDDYGGHVLSVLQTIVADDPENLKIIAEVVEAKCSEAGENVSSHDASGRRIVFSPTVFRAPETNVDRNLVSVMMPFDAGLLAVYDAIRNAASDAGLQCRRADDIWNDSTIIQDVFSLIFCSFIVVCDFSGRNPNVFYETGIAHTLGKHVIPITQSRDDVPFDLRQHRSLLYLNNSEGRETLKSKLAERMKTLDSKQNPPL